MPQSRKDSSDMDPIEFENRVGDLFEKLGYQTTVTQRTHDGGIDLEGKERGLGNGKIVVQCKKFFGTVGVNYVRELWGVINGDNTIKEGYLVTTSSFSNEAQKFAGGKRMPLIDGVGSEALFRQYIDEGSADKR